MAPPRLQEVTGHSIFYRGLVSLVPPLHGRPRVAALWQSYADQIAEVERVGWEVLRARHVNSATGIHLDTLARIVGVARFSSDDEVFRNVVRAKIASNRSRGLEDDIRKVLRLGGGTTVPSTITHHSPATMKVIINQVLTDAGFAALTFLLSRTRAAGVGLHLLRPIDSSVFIVGSALDPSIGTAVGSAVSGTGATLASARRF